MGICGSGCASRGGFGWCMGEPEQHGGEAQKPGDTTRN